MSAGRQQGQPGSLHLVLGVGLAFWLAHYLWPGPYGPDLLKAAAVFVAALGCISAFKFLQAVCVWVMDFRRFWRAVRGDDSHGSAGWFAEKAIRKARLNRRKAGSRLIGTLGRTAIWLWTETHHLVLGPAGSAKTSAAIVPFLCSMSESCLINDTKGELYELTARLRAKLFGHRIVKLDPTDPNSAQVNPLDFIHELVMANAAEALTLLRGMVLQLYPEPPQEGMNRFFRDGSRRALAAVIMAVVVVCPRPQRTLATVYRAFSDADFLHDLLMEAGQSILLNGEVADMAEDLHRMAFGDEGAARTYEQFRIGALQALDPFGPGNYLARITATTTFSFTELKEGKVSCYLIVDHNNKETLGKWSGLMQWLAAYQLVRVRNNRPVVFVLDECCNAPLHTLPSILTLLRSYGIKCILATQDLDDFTRVYGKHALETILSETAIKQFLGGIRSQTTLEYLSKYLGSYTEHARNFSFAEDGVKESRGRTGRPLLTADELRRLPKDLQVVLFDNNKPILARKVPIFAAAPWRLQIGVNSMYGGKRHLLPVAIRVGRWRAKVTRRGRFRPKRRSAFWPVTGYLLRSFAPSAGFALLGCLAVFIYLEGFPHLRIEYAYSGSWSNPDIYHWCRYWGAEQFTLGPGDCPVIIFRKSW